MSEFGSQQTLIQAPPGEQNADELLRQVRALATELAARPNLGLQAAPKREIERIAEMGLLTAPLPLHEGGLGLGSLPGTQATLLQVLAAVGSADLALGRLYEGHINGLMLVLRYGSAAQVRDLSRDVRDGMLCGVWNTGDGELLRLVATADGYRMEGVKTFATGAAFVRRPIVTGEMAGQGWQMTLPRMERLSVAIDRSFWHPLGMESSESFGIDFTGEEISEEDLIGEPGDFYRDPMFRGGAIRFAAVQAGAVMRLHQIFAEWLEERGRAEDPYQIARLGEVAIAAQEAAMWVEKAAGVAEDNFSRSEKIHAERMVDCANMMRLAIERLATRVMWKVMEGAGAQGLLQPARFERIIRDLTMYLRQPAPDQTLASVGRSSVIRLRRYGEDSADGFWSHSQSEVSLPPQYFRRIYAREQDPWKFETSEYERGKYAATLAAIPRSRYERGLEVGCSIGVLTRLLADRCDELLGLDVSEKALERARERCQDLASVGFECLRVPQEMPEGEFDLIVISEVAYYWNRADLARAADALAARHAPGGHLVLVHLTEWVPDYPLTGDQVHDFWLERPEWTRVGGERHKLYRIDVLERR